MHYTEVVLRRYGRDAEETEQYVARVGSPALQHALYMDMKRWRRAAEVAAVVRDVPLLLQVYAVPSSPCLCYAATDGI